MLASESCMMETNCDCTKPKLARLLTAPVNSNWTSGGLVKPYCTASMMGISVVSGLSRMCILPDSLTDLSPNVTLILWLMVACDTHYHGQFFEDMSADFCWFCDRTKERY
mmetsp:Transcript_29601/g.61767  ORF Transcript_29601/g.61767 Transcript_29601/m.61767 type:complete len:110 (+) Transcript_29601:68-397(+)